MTTNQKKTEIKLTVEFLNKTLYPGFGNKIASIRPSGNRYSYTGFTKKDCIDQAKKAMRYNSSYSKEWNVIDN
jgi:hypothetical protein